MARFVLWALIPAVNIYNFATCPIEYLVEDGNGMRIGKLFQKPLFWLFVCLMVCSGASELAMAQWGFHLCRSDPLVCQKLSEI